MAKDHKRKARPITPAAVTVEPGCITVVVPDVLGKNESHRQAKRGKALVKVPSPQLEKYRASIEAAVAPLRLGGAGLQCLVSNGAWRIEVLGVWPTQNHEVGFVAPRGDADAVIPQALDALQHAGILDDDARVVEVRAWNLYRKGVRATVMRLVRVDVATTAWASSIPERDVAVAHLLHLLPPSPEPPAKSARKRKVKT